MEKLNNHENLITTLDQSLRQTRSVQTRLMERLSEVQKEEESLRAEIRTLEEFASQTEDAMRSLVGAVSDKEVTA